VGVNNNFFEIGGNSLLITKTYSELRKFLPNEVEYISLVDLFKYPTIRALAKFLNQVCQAPSSQPKTAELAKQLKEGKDRLKQKFKKSRLANMHV
jgi:hypothetical protein